MKKTLIALAAVAATTGVMAQTATIYGIVDTGYEWSTSKADVTTNKSAGLKSGTMAGSRIGFRGTEDLGGGLTAGFQIESGFTAGTGAGLDGFNRISQLSLAGGFGRLAIGRNLLPTYFVATGFDGTGGALNQTVTEIQALNGVDIRGNGLWYSNSFGDITFNSFITTGRTGAPGADSKLNGYDLSLSYASGPLAVGVGFASAKGRTPAVAGANTGLLLLDEEGDNAFDDGGDFVDGGIFTADTAATNGKVRGNVIGASYDFGVAKVMVSSIRLKGTDNLTGDVGKAAETNFGVSVPVSDAATVMFGYGRDKTTDADGVKSKANDYAMGVSYKLSARTNVFAFYSKNAAPVATGEQKSHVANTTVGIRHSF